MDIGKEVKEVEFEPLEAPTEQPVTPEPVPATPVPKPEPVPAGVIAAGWLDSDTDVEPYVAPNIL